ncbi:MAG: hypothetical protein ACRC57_07970 [Sarcina sp.]
MEKQIKKCENPKCVTNHEKYVKPSFKSNDAKNYICDFCSHRNTINK